MLNDCYNAIKTVDSVFEVEPKQLNASAAAVSVEVTIFLPIGSKSLEPEPLGFKTKNYIQKLVKSVFYY